MDKEMIVKCRLFMLSMLNDEVVIPAKDMKQYLNISNNKEECIENIFKILNKEVPTKPHHIENNTYCCMSCDIAFVIDDIPLMKESYCSNCGQKIDWVDAK